MAGLDATHTDVNGNKPDSVAISRLKYEARQAASSGYRGVKDVTADFTTASSQLLAGQLVKDDFFTLFEAVGALEIMDSKMDSGYVPPGDTFEADFEPSAGLEAAEVIWIMDELACLEMAWIDGYPLSQTVFTSLHIDRLIAPHKTRFYSFFADDRAPAAPSTDQSGLVHVVLLEYCKALVKCCQLAIYLIQGQNYYEEEDFVTHLFGRELLPSLHVGTAYDSLSGTLEWVSRSDVLDDVKSALLCRIRFRLSLLETLNGDSASWSAAVSELRSMNNSRHLAKATPAAFSDKVQRQLATSTPPRPMLQLSWDVAFGNWTKMCEDAIAAFQLTAGTVAKVPNCLQRATWAFAYWEEPNTLARAVMQDILFSDQAVAEVMPHYDLFLADIRELVLPGHVLTDMASFHVELPSDPRHVSSRLVEGFMDKAMDEYLNLYRMVCQNRCRMRRTFTQAIPILDALETEAAKIDRELHQVTTNLTVNDGRTGSSISFDPLSTWAKFYRLRVMIWTIQLGVETDIYLPHELADKYWFLYTLSSELFSLLHYIERFTGESMKHSRDKKSKAECQNSLAWLNSLQVATEVTQSLAGALWRLYNVLESLRIVSLPKRDFADPQLLYEARMKPFLTITNGTIPSLADFEQSRHVPGESVNDTCRWIDNQIKAAKSGLQALKGMSQEQAKYVGTEEEWTRNIKRTETTCVALAVAASQLLRLRQKYASEDLSSFVSCTFERKYHAWWTVPRLHERKR